MDQIGQPPNPYSSGPVATAAPGRRRGTVLVSRAALFAVIACALAAGGYGIASAASAHGGTVNAGQSLASAPAASKPATTTPPSKAVSPPLGRFGGGIPGRGGPFGLSGLGGAGGGTVTAIAPSSITVENEFGRYLTVKTNSSTTYSENGKQVSRSSLATGEQVVFSRMPQSFKPGSSGETVVSAVEIVLPQVSGKVVSMSDSQIVVRQSDGLDVTVETSGATYTEAGQTASSDDVTTGTVVSVTGTVSADHTQIDATSIEIVLPSVSGRVTGVSGSTITISSFGGTTETVTTGNGTKFRTMPGNKSATISSVAKGEMIEVLGSYGSGNTFSAQLVEIGPTLKPTPSPGWRSGGAGSGSAPSWPLSGMPGAGFPTPYGGSSSQSA